MKVLSDPKEAHALSKAWGATSRIALVPTMGCLHEGHLALVQRARKIAERVVVSIFVNPLQFGPMEDFDKYPRTFEQDRSQLAAAGVDLLFHPSVDELYPTGFQTRLCVGERGMILCGQTRPGHFDGVGTVVLKLLNIVRPDFAVFGEKDFQQLQIIRALVKDLNVATAIISHPTIRERDGLAMSSRNRYLSSLERKQAIVIPESLRWLTENCSEESSVTVAAATKHITATLTAAGGKVEYVQIVDPNTLLPAEEGRLLIDSVGQRCLLAVRFGATRLIDNCEISQGVTL